MPRVKSSGQIEALERQQKELLEKLRAAKAKARMGEREQRLERARIAGLAFLDELEANPASETALALLALLDSRLTRRAEREAFGLVVTTAEVANMNEKPATETDEAIPAETVSAGKLA